jgi:hypothetical protein
MKRGKPRRARHLRNVASPLCTISGQVLVDGLHSIENTLVMKRAFQLTLFSEGVQQDRSLTAS